MIGHPIHALFTLILIFLGSFTLGALSFTPPQRNDRLLFWASWVMLLFGAVAILGGFGA